MGAIVDQRSVSYAATDVRDDDEENVVAADGIAVINKLSTVNVLVHIPIIVVKFGEINLKFEKVQKSSKKFKKVQKSSKKFQIHIQSQLLSKNAQYCHHSKSPIPLR